MKIQNQYIIQFGGLKEGLHDFEFQFQKKFFDEFPSMEAQDGNLTAQVNLQKKRTFLVFKVTLSGSLKLQCDRCLEYYEQEIHFDGKFYVKFSDREDNSEETDEVIFLNTDEQQIDLKHYFYESISLSIPYKRMHPTIKGRPGCNNEMLKFIEDYSDTKHQEEENPVWDKLKDFLRKQ